MRLVSLCGTKSKVLGCAFDDCVCQDLGAVLSV